MRKLAIEYISVFGLPPVEFVHLAADLGCAHISTGAVPMPYNPHGYPGWSLVGDRALRRRMIAAMHERDVSISIGEGFLVRPGVDVRDYAAPLDVMRELGVTRINTLSIDPGMNRSFDQFAMLTQMAAAVDVATTLEFGPRMAVADLGAALTAIRHVAQPHFRLVIDTMHLVRSGAGGADIAALDPDMIGYVQLCDAPLVSKFSEYMDEAKYERMVPGTGELPLLDILAALPRDLPIGLEVPQRSLAEAGVGPHERLGRCVEATRKLLAQLALRSAQ